jgi:hypothetical protein
MNYYTQPQKAQFREAVTYIAERERSFKERPPIIGFAWRKEYLDYYFMRQGAASRVTFIAGEPKDLPKVLAFIHTLSPSQYLWYIACHKKPAPKFLSFLKSHMKVVICKGFKEAEVWLFQKE